MATTNAKHMFSVVDAKYAPITADTGSAGTTTGAAVDLYGIKNITLNFEAGQTQEQRGDNTVLSRAVERGALTGSFTVAGRDLGMLSALFGGTLKNSGTGPNQTDEYVEAETPSQPFVDLKVLVPTNDGGEMLIHLYKIQVNGDQPALQAADNAFMDTEIAFTAYYTDATFAADTPHLAAKRRLRTVKREGTARTGVAA